MGPFLTQLEQSGLATWIRESGVLYGYPLVLFLHTLGLSTVVGLSPAIDLRLLGIAPGIPLESLQKTFGLLWAGQRRRPLAAASLGCWFIALSAGRLMAYVSEFVS